MKLGEAEKFTKDQLKAIYDDREAANIADLVLEHVSSFSRIDRLTKKDIILSDVQHKNLLEQINRLIKNEPIQYILNKSWFYGLELYIDKGVLIPRPETEELVSWIINDVRSSGKDVFNRLPNESDQTTQLKILDVGTGSGCIALALKKNIEKVEVWGCDKSEEALNVAR